MSAPPFVPPLKCQGIKTKLARDIQELSKQHTFDRWIEPFCGSCVVALNVQPKRALLADTNVHIIRLYQDIQKGHITPALAREFLTDEGAKLSTNGEDYYYSVRDRFNSQPNSLDFLFLNRSCFNGVMRFNRLGKFNVPYGHKPQRFARPYVTKIANQIAGIAQVASNCDWTFIVADFRKTLAEVKSNEVVYADPPYAGRHVDYFNSWSEEDELQLTHLLKQLPCGFILSTWHSNQFRTNTLIEDNWSRQPFKVLTREHFYHVGASENLRHPMVEALITNLDLNLPSHSGENSVKQNSLFDLATN